jgi:hypothetical protein
MISRLLCGVVAVAMAGPCLGQESPKAPRPVSQTDVKQYSPSTTPNSRPPIVGIPSGSVYRNGYPNGSCCTTCGPGTQYLARDCGCPLDLSHGIGLWDPCNAWCPHPGPNCCYGCR